MKIKSLFKKGIGFFLVALTLLSQLVALPIQTKAVLHYDSGRIDGTLVISTVAQFSDDTAPVIGTQTTGVTRTNVLDDYSLPGSTQRGTVFAVHRVGSSATVGYAFCIEADQGIIRWFPDSENVAAQSSRGQYSYYGTVNNAQLKRALSWLKASNYDGDYVQAFTWRALNQVTLVGSYATAYSQFEQEYAANPNSWKFNGTVNIYEYRDSQYDGQRIITFDYAEAPKEGFIAIRSKVDKETRKPIPGVKFGIYTDAQATQKIAEIVTVADGSAITPSGSGIEIGQTYYVRELTYAEGQTRGIIPSNRVAEVIVRDNSTQATPTYVRWGQSETLENVMEQFRVKFTKEDYTSSNTNFDNVGYKLRVISLVKDLNKNQFPTGGFVKEGRDSSDDLILRVVNGEIKTPRYDENLPILDAGRYELVEFEVPNEINALLAPTGAKIVFENLGDLNSNNTTDDDTVVISNNTIAMAQQQQNAIVTALGGQPIPTPNLTDSQWAEAIPLGVINIRKEDKNTQQPLQGFKFKLVSPQGVKGIWTGTEWVAEKEYVTGTNGEVFTDPLILGTYTVEEVEAQAPYSNQRQVQTVTVTSATSLAQANKVTFQNEQQLMNISITKRAIMEDFGTNLLAGNRFEIVVKSLVMTGIQGQKQPGEVVGTYTLANDGVLTVNDLPLGTYIIREVGVADNFQLNSGVIEVTGTYSANAGTHTNQVAYNNQAHNTARDQMVATFANVGHTLAPTNLRGLSNTIFDNAFKLGVINIRKEDKNTQQPLQGFKFKLVSPQGVKGIWTGTEWVAEKEYVTGTNGEVFTDPLILGTYTVQEVETVLPYLFAEPVTQTVTVTENHNNLQNALKVMFQNEQQLFDFTISKDFATVENGGASLEGAQFEVTVVSLLYPAINNHKQPGEVVGLFTTDAQGKLTVTDLPLGVYTVKEVGAPTGTVLNQSILTVRGDYDGTQNKKSSIVHYDFSNNRSSVTAKLDEMTSKLNIVWNSLLPQAEIGTKTWTNVQVGLTPKVANEDNVFKNLVIMGRVEINKHYDLDPEINTGPKPAEEGIIFEIYKDGVKVDEFVTNSMGRGASKYLPYGEYTMSQFNTLTGPDGTPIVNKVKDFNFKITEDGQVLHYTLENTPNRMRLKIEKLDEVTGQNILQEGVQFELYNSNDELVTFTQYYPEEVELDRITISAKTGGAVTIETLAAGNYYLKEVAGPVGYVYDPEVKIPVTIPHINDGSVPTVTITIGRKTDDVVHSPVENTPQYGELVVTKVGEKLTSWTTETVNFDVQEKGTVEQRQVVTPQANVTLVVKSITEKEIEVDTTTIEINEQGKEVVTPSKETKVIEVENFENVHTNADGVFEQEYSAGTYEVYLGDSLLVSKVIPQGTTELIKVELPDIVEVQEVYIDGAIVNKSFTYSKPVYEVSLLADAKFKLVAKEDLKSYDNQTVFFNAGDVLPIAQQDITVAGKVVYKKGEVITLPTLDASLMNDTTYVDYTFTTTDTSASRISRIPLGNIEMQEVVAPLGYKLDDTVRSFEFTPQENTIKVDLKEAEPINNEREILTLSLGNKVVEETQYFGRNSLEYIVFGIYTKGAVFGLPAGELVGVVKPDENGVMTFNDVVAGEYVFKEISTKDSYVLSEEEYTINAQHTQNTTTDSIHKLEVKIVNQPVEGKEIYLTKVDVQSGETLQGVPFKLFAVLNDGTEVPVMNGHSDLWYTDEHGKIKTDKLPQGNYVWKEVKAQDGYVREDKTFMVAVAGDSNLQVVIENTPTNVGFRKFDSVTGKPVINATLRLEVFENGQWIPVLVNDKGYVAQSGEILEWVTDGTIKPVLGLKLDKTYRLVEVKVPNGYITAEPFEFTVNNSKGLQVNSLSNQMTRVIVKKLDESSKQPVYGATLELYEQGSTEIFVDPVTGEAARWTTTEENQGQFLINGLEVGKTYVIKETVVPNGYLEPITETSIFIADRGEVQVFVMFNEPIPTIKTTAMFQNGTKANSVDESTNVIDKVHLTKLIVGKEYETKARLVDVKDTGKLIATASIKFVATDNEMTVDVVFENVPAKALAGSSAVVFEELYKEGRLLAVHAEVNDLDQTIYFPHVKTTANDKETGEKIIKAEGTKFIRDKLSYTNLEKGKEYVAKGYLMDKDTNQPLLDKDGNRYVGETVFVAEESNGYVYIDFTVDASLLVGKKVVVFESVYENGVEIAVHHDINDLEQTVIFPHIKTQAQFENGLKTANPQGKVVVEDTVEYTNLIVGRTYVGVVRLMDKTTKTILLDKEGKPFIKEVEFVAEEMNGTYKVSFEVDADGLDGKELVYFEEIFILSGELNDKRVPVGEHKDWEDEGQTVRFSKVGTQVSNTEVEEGKVTLTDTIAYENLEIGKVHNALGYLVDKANGKVLLIDGKPVYATAEFTPTELKGTVDVVFTFDTTGLGNRTFVVFEEIFIGKLENPLDVVLGKEPKGGTLVGTHKDTNDVNQTFKVREMPKTNAPAQDNNQYIIYGGVGLALALAVIFITRKREEKE